MRKLGQEHLDYLLSPRTLELWCGKTMRERVILFHRQFPNKRIAPTSLRRLYLRHAVRRKKVRQEKNMPLSARKKFVSRCGTMLAGIAQAKAEGRLIVYLDEVNFTKRSLYTCDYACKNSNLTVNQEDIYIGYRSVIAAITEDGGVDLCLTYTQAVTGADFINYLRALHLRHDRRPLTLLMDNLPLHKANLVQEQYPAFDIRPLWNVPWAPEFNPVEAVFSKVKAIFNCKRLICFVNKLVTTSTATSSLHSTRSWRSTAARACARATTCCTRCLRLNDS